MNESVLFVQINLPKGAFFVVIGAANVTKAHVAMGQALNATDIGSAALGEALPSFFRGRMIIH